MSIANEDTQAIIQSEECTDNELEDITPVSTSPGPASPLNEKRRLSESQGSARTRKPFHFRNSLVTSTLPGITAAPALAEEVPIDAEEEATYSRFKYYQRLRGAPKEDSALIIPDHVVPSIFFYPFIPGRAPLTGKQSSLITIFAVWNTMMGTSLLSMPWAVEQAGLVAGLCLILTMAAVCFYTAYCILKVFGTYSERENLPDLPDVCLFLLGRFWQLVSIIFSALSLLGACAVYWVLMSNFLFYTGKYIYASSASYSLLQPSESDASNTTLNLLCLHPNKNSSAHLTAEDFITDRLTFDRYWNLHLTVPIYMAIIILPVICFKSATFFTKFNALGTVSVFYIMTFVTMKATSWGLNVEFDDRTSPYFVPLVNNNFPALTGILALALFLHNCVVSIMKSNQNQSNNGRDLAIAYVLVAATYVGIGATFYLSFPLEKNCIADNLLNNFTESDVMTVAARIFLLFQMMTVFPLLAFILRAQILYAIFNSIYPSLRHVIVLNVLLLTVCILTAIFLPEVGTITRFSGAICGLVYIFTLPSILYVTSVKKENSGNVPMRTYAIHGVIIVIGVANLVAQFII